MAGKYDRRISFPDVGVHLARRDEMAEKLVAIGINPYDESEAGEDYIPEGIDADRAKRADAEMTRRELEGLEGVANYVQPAGDNREMGSDRDPNARYRTLVAKAGGLPISKFEGIDTKRRLLRRIFPDKFGVGGRQDITGYSDVQVGKLYANILKSAKDALKREKKR